MRQVVRGGTACTGKFLFYNFKSGIALIHSSSIPEFLTDKKQGWMTPSKQVSGGGKGIVSTLPMKVPAVSVHRTIYWFIAILPYTMPKYPKIVMHGHIS